MSNPIPATSAAAIPHVGRVIRERRTSEVRVVQRDPPILSVPTTPDQSEGRSRRDLPVGYATTCRDRDHIAS